MLECEYLNTEVHPRNQPTVSNKNQDGSCIQLKFYETFSCSIPIFQ